MVENHVDRILVAFDTATHLEGSDMPDLQQMRQLTMMLVALSWK